MAQPSALPAGHAALWQRVASGGAASQDGSFVGAATGLAALLAVAAWVGHLGQGRGGRSGRARKG